jgi:hypothetical protein
MSKRNSRRLPQTGPQYERARRTSCDICGRTEVFVSQDGFLDPHICPHGRPCAPGVCPSCAPEDPAGTDLRGSARAFSEDRAEREIRMGRTDDSAPNRYWH